MFPPNPGLNAEVVYSLAEPANGYFSVEEATGVIRLEKPLKESQASSMNLSVCAKDKGFPHSLSSLATVTVSVVDLKEYLPVFLDTEYVVVVQEDVAVGTEVLNLSLLTRDSVQGTEIKYEIMNGNDHGKFRLHSNTGMWTVWTVTRSPERVTSFFGLCQVSLWSLSQVLLTSCIKTYKASLPLPGFP